MAAPEQARNAMKKRPGKAKEGGGASPPSVRLPLPRKSEKRHGDRKKYDRAREKERLRRERLRLPPP